MKFSRIVTHLFADGGRIIRTARIDYVEHVEKDDVASIVRSLMKEQHRAMFTALRAGELDDALEKALGPLPESPVTSGSPAVGAPGGAAAPSRRENARPSSDRPRRRSISNPNLRGVAPSVPPPPADAFDLDVASLDRIPGQRAPSRPPSSRKPKSRPPAVPPRVAAAPQRPATQLSNPPSVAARSIFGDGAVSEQTLDEVILSYLAEDLDGGEEE